VASEVKALANQTAGATKNIGRMIATIQGDTTAAVTAIGEIRTIITQINEIQTTPSPCRTRWIPRRSPQRMSMGF
jgi:methyl-accepting chemotaxis protein